MLIKIKKQREYYQALLDKNSAYEGVFYVGVKTTGIFCRPTCPARKPKFKHCEFYQKAQQALLASFRPCLRCQPLSHPNHVSPLIKILVDAVEAEPEKRWKDTDFQALSVNASTVKRQFQKRFGMTFVGYARARRLGLVMKHIRAGGSVIDAQLVSGYESSSGFRDAFSKIMGAAPTKTEAIILKAAWIDTPLGPMVTIADDKGLYLLEFVDRRGLEREVERLRKKKSAAIIPGETAATKSIEKELKLYFSGKLKEFKTLVHLVGSNFQESLWRVLQKIPLGKTCSYADQAKAIGKPTASRAVANANGMNPLAIIIPCHRVIHTSGGLGGYGGGLARKEWLLKHEQGLTFRINRGNYVNSQSNNSRRQ